MRANLKHQQLKSAREKTTKPILKISNKRASQIPSEVSQEHLNFKREKKQSEAALLVCETQAEIFKEQKTRLWD